MKDRDSINRGRKFDQVRDGAARIFLRDGYAAANVDDIARAARVSKATLYSYFPDKKLMFTDVVAAEITRAFALTPFDADFDSHQARPGLEHLLLHLGEWLARPDMIQLHRVVLAEAGRFAGLGRSYHAGLDRVILAPLVDQVDRWVGLAQIRTDDSGRLSRQILNLLSGEIHQAALLAEGNPVPQAEVAELAHDTAQLILRAHGTS